MHLWCRVTGCLLAAVADFDYEVFTEYTKPSLLTLFVAATHCSILLL